MTADDYAVAAGYERYEQMNDEERSALWKRADELVEADNAIVCESFKRLRWWWN